MQTSRILFQQGSHVVLTNLNLVHSSLIYTIGTKLNIALQCQKQKKSVSYAKFKCILKPRELILTEP